MTLKFDVMNDQRGYGLHVDGDETSVYVDASEAELRRLLIDLQHEFGTTETSEPEGAQVELEHDECRVCGVDLDEVVPDGMIRPIPYCPADMPTECPACGCEDVGWSAVKMAFVCDNGCDPWRPEA